MNGAPEFRGAVSPYGPTGWSVRFMRTRRGMIRRHSAARKLADLRSGLSQLHYGDHACPVYETRAEQIAVAVAFLQAGLTQNERCIFVAPRQLLDPVQSALAAAHVDIDDEMARGVLQVLHDGEAYLLTGKFDPAGMLAYLARAESDALAAGFAGVRYIGEMSWSLANGDDNQLLQYEAQLNRFISNRRMVILCQYDRHRFNPSIIQDLIRTHPLVVFGDDVYPNPYYEPPELLLAPTRKSDADAKKVRIDWWLNALRSARETEKRRTEAEQLAATLEDDRLRAIARANDMAARMYAITEIAAGVTVAETIDELREILVEACKRVISFDALIIASYDDASHTFGFLGAWDQGVYSTPAVVSAAGTPAERVVRERRTLITHRATDPEAAGAVLTGTRRRSESVIRAPLIAADKVLGVLAIHSYTPDLYNAEDARVVEAVAALASAAIQRIQSRAEKDAELQRRQAAEEQLAHAQKMEAVGRLAGGISHDFNNLLVAIGGYAHLAFAELETDHPARADLLEVMQGVERATALTRQLLAFSRKQVLLPIDVDLAKAVRETERLVRRLIRADIVLNVSANASCQVKVDPGQLEQVIVNLVVNARDAMPHGGRIDVSVERMRITEASKLPVGAAPGEYACLSVSDNGEGMDAKTRESIFEPFFTTKPSGQGTGLGLSMVYGIIKQSGGYIDVHSEPGVGTRMDIYLPCTGRPDSDQL